MQQTMRELFRSRDRNMTKRALATPAHHLELEKARILEAQLERERTKRAELHALSLACWNAGIRALLRTGSQDQAVLAVSEMLSMHGIEVNRG